MTKVIAAAVVWMFFATLQGFTQPTRNPVTMTEEEVKGFLLGEGLGQGKPAEVFGYPGPKHVLELAKQLELTSEQKGAVESIFSKMQREAKYLGHKIVGEELALDGFFRDGKKNFDEISNRVEKIGYLRWKCRLAHLKAHIMTRSILTPEQISKYQELRAGAAGSANQN